MSQSGVIVVGKRDLWVNDVWGNVKLLIRHERKFFVCKVSALKLRNENVALRITQDIVEASKKLPECFGQVQELSETLLNLEIKSLVKISQESFAWSLQKL